MWGNWAFFFFSVICMPRQDFSRWYNTEDVSVKNLSECFICLIKLSFYSSPSLGLLLFAGTCGAEELCHSPFCPLMPPFPPCVSLCVSAPTPHPPPTWSVAAPAQSRPLTPCLGQRLLTASPMTAWIVLPVSLSAFSITGIWIVWVTVPGSCMLSHLNVLHDGSINWRVCGKGRSKWAFVIGDLFLSLNYGGFFTLQVCHGCDESPCVSCGELVCDFSSMKVMKWAKISNGLQK